jgi:hypothetical protein
MQLPSPLAPLFCSAPTEELYAYGHPIAVAVDPDPTKPLPREIVWVPAGEHDISAHGAGMQPVQARVVGDAEGASAITAHFEALRASGSRVWLDKNHEDAEASADVRGFAWDPARGIVATVDWTPYGEKLLRDRVFCSFSPAFLRNKATGRPSMLMVGHAAGGLVNAPAFGAAMPALIAARLAGAESNATTAPAGSAGKSSASTAMNKELLIKLLAALGVTLAPDADAAATDAAITQAMAKASAPVAASSAGTPPNAELEVLRGQLATVRKERATTAVNTAVARGALPAKDEAIQAKWLSLIQADPSHEALLAALPGNAALERKTQPGAGIIQVHDGAVDVLRALASTKPEDSAKRSEIYGRDIAPLLDKGLALGPILASNSLGTLSGELITQRSLSLLKRTYPALSAFSTDFTGDNAAFDQTIRSRLRSIPSVTDYDTSRGGYQTSSATATDVPVVINGHKAVQISFNAGELARTDRDLFGEQAEGAHAAIAADLFDALLAVITPANFANESAIALNNFSRASMSTISKALTARHVARAGRAGLLNLDYYEKLGQDSNIVTLAAYQKPEVITEGELPRIAKIQPFEVEDFPTDDNLVGFAGSPDSLVLATRVPSDYTKVMPGANGGGVVQYIQNPDLGFTVMLVQYVDHGAGAAFWRLAYMRGAAVGNGNCGQRIVSAATSS